jgi:hypothetical protein
LCKSLLLCKYAQLIIIHFNSTACPIQEISIKVHAFPGRRYLCPKRPKLVLPALWRKRERGPAVWFAAFIHFVVPNREGMETMRRLFFAMAALSLVSLGLGCHHCSKCNQCSGCNYASHCGSGCGHQCTSCSHGSGCGYDSLYGKGNGCIHGVCDCDQIDWCNPYGIGPTVVATAPAPKVLPKDAGTVPVEKAKEKELE